MMRGAVIMSLELRELDILSLRYFVAFRDIILVIIIVDLDWWFFRDMLMLVLSRNGSLAKLRLLNKRALVRRDGFLNNTLRLLHALFLRRSSTRSY